LASNAAIPAATGNIPYAAATLSEFAVVNFDFGTRSGTIASLAGDHNMVMTSKANDATTSPTNEFTKGSVTNTAALPKSHAIMT